MNLQEMRDFLKTVRVPPNMELRFIRSSTHEDDVVLAAVVTWPDIDDPSTTFKGRTTRVISMYNRMHHEVLRAHVLSLVYYAWEHELSEWLQIDGEYVKDPHPERRR
jgi:hypothetical protein